MRKGLREDHSKGTVQLSQDQQDRARRSKRIFQVDEERENGREDRTDSSLKYHIVNAKDHGVSQKEMAAIITHVAFYAGWPKAWAVFNLAKEVYSD